MTSNGKQFSVTREMLTAVAGISARFSKFAFVLFCYITNHVMTGPLGNSEFCFPRISMFPSTSSRETLRFSGNKIHCSPRDQSLSVKYSLRLRRIIVNYKHEWQFGRSRNAAGTRAAGERFHSFFEFSQTFTSVCITR